MTCGKYTVERRDHDGLLGDVRVLGPGGVIAYQAKPKDAVEQYDAHWCLDLDGNGSPELSMSRYTGGAHCCTIESILSLGATVTTLLEYDARNAAGLVPQNVDRKGPFELVGADDVLTEVSDVAYALSPFLPVVFALEKGHYVRRTAHYPEFLRARRDEATSELTACEGDVGCAIGRAEGVLGLSLLLGDWPAVRDKLGLSGEAAKHVEATSKRLGPKLRRREP
jgi:hypothetical protein